MPTAPTVPTFTTLEGLTSADLQALSTAISWSTTNKPVFRGRQTVAQSIPNNAFTAVTLDTEDKDNQNGHSTVTNTSRYVAPYDGWYLVSGGYGAAAGGTGIRALAFAVNGAFINATQSNDLPSAATTAELPSAAELIFLLTGDYVELQVYQNNGAALNTAVAGSQQPHMNVVWVCT